MLTIANSGSDSYLNSQILVNPNQTFPYFIRNTSSLSLNDQYTSLHLIEKLEYLLKSDHKSFWNQVNFNKSISESVKCFSIEFYRPFECQLDICDIDESDIKLYNLFYILIVRLGNNKEVKVEQFTQNYGKIIYDSRIFEIPVLLNLMILYGETNNQILSKIVQNLFKSNPNYTNDFIKYIPRHLEFLKNKFSAIFAKNFHKFDNFLGAKNFFDDEKCFTHLLSIYEAVKSLYLLIDSLKEIPNLFERLYNETELIYFIISKFNEFFPFINEKFEEFSKSNDEAEVNKENIDGFKWLFASICVDLAKIWRVIFQYKFLDSIVNNKISCFRKSSTNFYHQINDCLQVLIELHNNKYLAAAVNLFYPLQVDKAIILDAVDDDEYSYYKENFEQVFNEIEKDLSNSSNIIYENSLKVNGLAPFTSGDNSSQCQLAVDSTTYECISECYPNISRNDVEAYIMEYNCTGEDMLHALMDGAIDVGFIKQISNKYKRENENKKANKPSNSVNVTGGASGVIKSGADSFANHQISKELSEKILQLHNQQLEEEEEEQRIANKYKVYLDDELDDHHGELMDALLMAPKRDEVNEMYEEENVNKQEEESQQQSQHPNQYVDKSSTYYQKLQRKKHYNPNPHQHRPTPQDKKVVNPPPINPVAPPTEANASSDATSRPRNRPYKQTQFHHSQNHRQHTHVNGGQRR